MGAGGLPFLSGREAGVDGNETPFFFLRREKEAAASWCSMDPCSPPLFPSQTEAIPLFSPDKGGIFESIFSFWETYGTGLDLPFSFFLPVTAAPISIFPSPPFPPFLGAAGHKKPGERQPFFL